MPMTNEPTTVNIAKALRVCFEKTCACSECPFEHESCGDIEQLAADRLESQERENASLRAENKGLHKEIIRRGIEIKTMTARAESAERERDAAIADLKFLDRCKTCFHAKTRHLIGSECKTCKALSNFKWRGLPQEGEGKR